MRQEGILVKAATKPQQLKEHTDIIVVDLITNKEVRIDLKTKKDGQGEFATLELLGNYGQAGWLFCSKVNYIAFQPFYNEKKYIIIPRTALLKMIPHSFWEWEDNNPRPKLKEVENLSVNTDKRLWKDYTRYRRVDWGHSDLVLKVPFKDILKRKESFVFTEDGSPLIIDEVIYNVSTWQW